MPISFTDRRPLALSLALIAAVSLLFTGPISDMDFWWHIASGRWIWERHALPAADPFAIYPQLNHWAQTILQGQWAGQIALYLAYGQAGVPGLLALRVLLLGGVLASIAYRLIRDDCPLPLLAGALLTAGVALSGFVGDRPQLFSFLAFGLLLVILEAATQRRALRWATLPLLVVWTNVHQGVLLGAAIAFLWLGALAWRDWRAGAARHALITGIVALAALLAPLATPIGTRGIEYTLWLETQPARQRASEYLSPLAYLPDLARFPYLLAYFAFAALLVLLIARRARRAPHECAIPALLLAASLSAYRYIPFVIIMATPFVAAHFKHLASAAWPRRALAGLMAAVIAVTAAMMVPRLRAGPGHVQEALFPTRLVERARELQISGRVFTYADWGGYLIWQLGPQATPYIDGRYMMDTSRLDDYMHILWASGRGRRLFEAGNFDWVMVPYRNAVARNAQTYPLIDLLRDDPQWELRMANDQGVLFSRRTAAGS